MAKQPTKTVRDLFLEALAIQLQAKQQGKDVSPLEVAQRLKSIGRDAGYTIVDLLDQPSQDVVIELAFIGYGRIWWNGSEWNWSGNP